LITEAALIRLVPDAYVEIANKGGALERAIHESTPHAKDEVSKSKPVRWVSEATSEVIDPHDCDKSDNIEQISQPCGLAFARVIPLPSESLPSESLS
jgi:hypothetical protein